MVAASKPTSWLSVQSDIVYHLAENLGLSLRSGLFPFLTMELIPHSLTATLWTIGIRSLPDFSNLVGPLGETVLYNQ